MVVMETKHPELLKSKIKMEDAIILQSRNLGEPPDFTKDQKDTKQLYLDYNIIKCIPEYAFVILNNLVILSLVGNDIESLPGSIGLLNKLEELYLNENQLTSLPEALTQLKSLRKLNIVGNMVKCLPKNFGALINLQQLNADENLLQEIPESFGNLSELHILELADNNLLSLPSSFGKLSSLHTLNLSGNKISHLPKSFGDLDKLKHLDLSENALQTLPEVFNSAQILEKFFFDQNYITWWPDWMADMPHLKELSSEDNRLTGDVIPESFGKNSHELKSLNLAGNFLTALPDSIGQLINLESLHLGSCIDELERRAYQNGNRLTTLPDTFCQLTTLRHLRLDENKILALPENFGNLSSLDSLDLGQNHLRELPPSFCNLRMLRYCQLSRNQIDTLPDRMDLMTGLRDLRLDNNLITQLPDSLGELTNLQTLDLFNNMLTTVPPFIHKLTGLRRLDLAENKFQLKVKDTPRVHSGINYPTRDPGLKDNWRGKDRGNLQNYEAHTIVEADEEIEQEEDQEPEYNEHRLELAVRRNLSLWRSHTGASIREKFEQPSVQPAPKPSSPLIDTTVTDFKVNGVKPDYAAGWESEVQFSEDNWDDEITQTTQPVPEESSYTEVATEDLNPWEEDDQNWGTMIQTSESNYDLQYRFIPCETHPTDTQKVRDNSCIPEQGQFDDADESDH